MHAFFLNVRRSEFEEFVCTTLQPVANAFQRFRVRPRGDAPASAWCAGLDAVVRAAGWPLPAHAERIKEVAVVQGVRTNQLVGYGLVVGLDGTGDQTTQTPFTTQSLTSMLQQLGVTLPPGTSLQLKNVAAVMVTATLPAFAQPGQQIDVTVSSIGNAKSLRGGTLMTPLKGADGQIYAMAQGNLVVGGAGASAAGSKVQVNTLSAGRIPEGATVERARGDAAERRATFQPRPEHDRLRHRRAWSRRDQRQAWARASRRALDGRVVRVRMPATPDARVGFMADSRTSTSSPPRRPPRSSSTPAPARS